MPEVLMKLDMADRGPMATRLLAAASELEFPTSVIKSQTDGFLVPEEVHRYLFPSEYGEPEPETVTSEDDAYDALEFAELRDLAKNRGLSAGGSAEEIKARLRAADADGGE